MENSLLEKDSDAYKKTQQSTNLISTATLMGSLARGSSARQRFVESHISRGLAFQIRALRDRKGWSQEKLAEEVGMNQNAISRLENPSYGKPTITTLKRIASVFDVAVIVRFVPFKQLADWVSGTPFVDYGLSNKALVVPSFEEDWKVLPSRSESTIQASQSRHTNVKAVMGSAESPIVQTSRNMNRFASAQIALNLLPPNVVLIDQYPKFRPESVGSNGIANKENVAVSGGTL